MNKPEKIKSIVFAGGGSRCLWQSGFFQALPKQFTKTIENVSAVSAGSFMACIAFADINQECLEYFKKISSKNKKNFYPENLFSRKPLFPQYKMYRQGIMDLFGKKELSRLVNGPSIKILSAVPPKGMPPAAATIAGLAIYSIEKKIKYPIHPTWTKSAGFSPEITDTKTCKSAKELADAILQSSCTPPIMPILKKNNKTVLDGGLIDNVPAWILDKTPGKKLVLLSRKYPFKDIMEKNNRVYVQPSSEIKIKRWDYTSPSGIQEAYNQGFRDGENFMKNYTQQE